MFQFPQMEVVIEQGTLCQTKTENMIVCNQQTEKSALWVESLKKKNKELQFGIEGNNSVTKYFTELPNWNFFYIFLRSSHHLLLQVVLLPS